jgi:plasmid stabilization system protein ParE
MAEPIVTAAAEADYLEAFLWYRERSESAAERFEAEFERALSAIGDHPERYAFCDRRHRHYLMRRYPYQVAYRFQRDQVVIVAVTHGKRKPRYWHHR